MVGKVAQTLLLFSLFQPCAIKKRYIKVDFAKLILFLFIETYNKLKIKDNNHEKKYPGT